MKKIIKVTGIVLFTLGGVALASCNNRNAEAEEGEYQTKEVDFYKENNTVDRKVALRYYKDMPNVPYVGLNQYYKEFYKTNFDITQKDTYYTFKKDDAYIKLDTKQDTIEYKGMEEIGNHPDFMANTSKGFMVETTKKSTTPIPFSADLKEYNIPVYGSPLEVYVPFQFISNIITSATAYSVIYNEGSLYELDVMGQLSGGVEKMDKYYDNYYEKLEEDVDRKEDLIKFSYDLICFEIDNRRGFTTQMALVDNNILSIGLNGTLERYYPRIKELLLSKNKKEYQAGLYCLFSGLGDGGHTALLGIERMMMDDEIGAIIRDSEELQTILVKGLMVMAQSEMMKEDVLAVKKSILGESGYYYKYDSTAKIAYIGFDSFLVNYTGWDEYYTKVSKGETPTMPANDSYAHVRSSLYKAMEDGAENVVIDLSTNTGGDSGAVVGIVGLLTGGEVVFSTNNTAEKTKLDEISKVDINLDGKYNDLDKAESEKFKSLNISFLTSTISFSCGNLLPSLAKELGYKIIGHQSGGGSCAIMLGATAEGYPYVRSSYLCLSNEAGENIDSGVPVDLELLEVVFEDGIPKPSYNKFYDMAYVASQLNQ